MSSTRQNTLGHELGLTLVRDSGRLRVGENQIVRPPTTPVLFDDIRSSVDPYETDTPSTDLNQPPSPYWGMASVAIPRHGSRPGSLPHYWPTSKPLPGAVNVSFYDGHGELVKLERLWQLDWNATWQAPAKRPGLW